MGWKIGIHRESRIPLAEQIAAQVAEALREPCHRPRRGRLPSAGRLAARLGVHRETARRAYRSLADVGLVRIVPGSGVYRRRSAGDRDPDLRSARAGSLPAAGSGAAGSSPDEAPSPFRRFLAAERRAGRSGGQTAALLREWMAGASAGRVLVAAPENVRTLVTSEVRAALPGVRVDPLVPAGRGAGGRGATGGHRFRGPVAATPESVEEAARSVSPAAEIVPLRYAAWGEVRRLLIGARVGALVAVASRCPAVERKVRALAAGLRGTAVGVAAVKPGGGPRAERVLRLARIVLVDVLAEASLEGRRVPGSIRRLRLIGRSSTEAVARRLTGPDSRASSRTRGGTGEREDPGRQIVGARRPEGAVPERLDRVERDPLLHGDPGGAPRER